MPVEEFFDKLADLDDLGDPPRPRYRLEPQP
jgi:hypothetical protein